MDPRYSLKVYPRNDVAFKAKGSYNFETIRSKIYLNRKKDKLEELYRWLVHGVIGVIVGTIAFFMAIVEDETAIYRAEHTQHMITTAVDDAAL